ncbi:hypothetical protein [uncultured Draconibacterium sp.]|uniref:hypothetical protein n=1 Tax=uncultured Draconibacterium sp. TaxID=1573823 RepID=UPI002AA66EB8|nr:hypothetical protein [uncultured Draconibacterium sp.]
MNNKDITIFFKAIRDSDLIKVKELVQSDCEFVRAIRKSPPKKDDGQSGLQVAFKTGNFEIAKYLIDSDADINFIDESKINEWNMPVFHDCIRAVIFNCKTLQSDTTKFDSAFLLLQIMIEKGTDPNSIDSYGNNCLHRAILDSRQMIEHPNAKIEDGILLSQLRILFNELIKSGADVELSNEKRPCALDLIKTFGLEKYELIK